MGRAWDHGEDAVRITSAARPHSEDIRGREKRYLISMGIRTACFIGAVLSIGHWFAWVFVVGAVFLPYVAVILANGGASPDPGGPDEVYEPHRQALTERPASWDEWGRP